MPPDQAQRRQTRRRGKELKISMIIFDAKWLDQIALKNLGIMLRIGRKLAHNL